MPIIYERIISKKKKKTFKFYPYIITAIPACILISLYFIFRSDRRFASAVVDNFAKPARSLLGYICSFVPFSVTELIYIVIFILASVFFIRTVFKVIRSDKKMQTFLKRLSILCIVLLYFYASFCFLWKFDYYTATFAEKAGISNDTFTAEELIEVTSYFVHRAAELSVKVERDNNGNFNESIPGIFAGYKHLYKSVQEEFPFLNGEVYSPKPLYLFSQIMSRTGFTGIYIAYTGEANINIDSPEFTIPCTIAHELAHQLGVYAENEANFVGILACTRSSIPAYSYSGYTCAAIHLMNALYEIDKSAWQELKNQFSDEMHTDWKSNNEYWNSMESVISKTASKTYDTYLKSNAQHQGIKSYNECTLLLVHYFKNIL